LRFSVAIAVLTSVVGITIAAPACAGDGSPVFVIPAKPGVPIIENARDVSYAFVYGDVGLKRPGLDLIIVGGTPAYPQGWGTAYFPATGRRPAYGRKEVEPPPGRRLPPPAPTYYRSWSSEPPPGPVTEYAPFETPPVTLEPRLRSNPTPPRRSPRQSPGR
jgi:hypothetical protein